MAFEDLNIWVLLFPNQISCIGYVALERDIECIWRGTAVQWPEVARVFISFGQRELFDDLVETWLVTLLAAGICLFLSQS